MNRPLWHAALLCLVSACNAADDPADGRLLGELGGDEVQALCDSIEAELGKTLTLEARCTLESASSTDSAAECEAEREACMQAGGDPINPSCTLPSRQNDAQCKELPVDEVLPCLDQVVDERLAVTCEDARYTEAQPECITRLSAQCPFGS